MILKDARRSGPAFGLTPGHQGSKKKLYLTSRSAMPEKRKPLFGSGGA
jgi:hypothetical protein